MCSAGGINLELAFPEKSLAERKKILHGVFGAVHEDRRFGHRTVLQEAVVNDLSLVIGEVAHGSKQVVVEEGKPPVLVVGTLAPGLGPKDVEKTITWRIEKYVSATPGVEHVESVSRNNLSIVYVWLKWGTDLNAAQTLVQQQVAFAMSAVPKSLGVLPPFVLQYDPSNAPVVQVAVTGGGLSGPQLYDYALNSIEPILEGIPGVASASINGGRQRQINIVVDPVAAQARGVTSSDIAAAVSQSNALLPSGVFISPKFDSNVYTNAVPERVSTITGGSLPATPESPCRHLPREL